MSNSSQVDKQPEVQQPGVQETSSRRPAAGQPRTWGSHRPGAATDMEQPRTWSSQGHGAATDLEQQWTWSSHGPGAATDMNQLQSRRADE